MTDCSLIFPIVAYFNNHFPGEALDIYDILKRTHNGVLEEDLAEKETGHSRAKGEILHGSK